MNRELSPEVIVLSSSCESTSSDEEMAEDNLNGVGHGMVVQAAQPKDVLRELLDIVHWLSSRSSANHIEKELIREKLEVHFEAIHKRILDQEQELDKKRIDNKMLKRRNEYLQSQLVLQQRELDNLKRESSEKLRSLDDKSVKSLKKCVAELQLSFEILIDTLGKAGTSPPASFPPWAADVAELQRDVGGLLTEAQSKLFRWERNQKEMKLELEQTKAVLHSFVKHLSATANVAVPITQISAYSTLKASVTVSPNNTVPPTLHIPSPPPPSSPPAQKPLQQQNPPMSSTSHHYHQFSPMAMATTMPVEVAKVKPLRINDHGHPPPPKSSNVIQSGTGSSTVIQRPLVRPPTMPSWTEMMPPNKIQKLSASEAPSSSPQQEQSSILPIRILPFTTQSNQTQASPGKIPGKTTTSQVLQPPPGPLHTIYGMPLPKGKTMNQMVSNARSAFDFNQRHQVPTTVRNESHSPVTPPPTPFKCLECREMFGTLVQLRLHSKVVHSSKTQLCGGNTGAGGAGTLTTNKV